MLRGLYSINHTFTNLTINKVNKLEEYLLAVTRSTLCKQRIARKSNPLLFACNSKLPLNCSLGSSLTESYSLSCGFEPRKDLL